MSSKKFPRLSKSVSELIDASIFSYACAQGLRKGLRCDIAVRGACIFLSNMLAVACESTMKDFETASGVRFENWRPGHEPTKSLKTFLLTR